jgi:hypothetical protein
MVGWLRWRRETRGHWQLRIGPLTVAWLTKRAAVQIEPAVRARLLAKERMN